MSVQALAYDFSPVEVEVRTRIHEEKRGPSANAGFAREITQAHAIWVDQNNHKRLIAFKGLRERTGTNVEIATNFSEMNALTSLLLNGDIKTIMGTRDCLNCKFEITAVVNKDGKVCEIKPEQQNLFECALREEFSAMLKSAEGVKQTLEAFRRPGVSKIEDFQMILKMQRNYYSEVRLIARRKAIEAQNEAMVDNVPSEMMPLKSHQ